MDTFTAGILIGLAVGILVGAVPVYAAWARDDDERRELHLDEQAEAVAFLRVVP